MIIWRGRIIWQRWRTRLTISLMYPLSGMCDFSQGDEKNYSLGFMELLGAQDFCPNSLSDTPQILSNNPLASVDIGKEYSLNTSTTNFSSMSSSSSKAVNVEPQTNDKSGEHQKEEAEDADEEKPQRKKGSKPKLKKKKSEKKPIEHRFVFKTRSEVDFMEDGYRWKKYGQKSAKDRPFPRSYFRCFDASCNVKKRVERCVEDPGVVVTTYEGQHIHPCPNLMPPPSPPNTIPMPPNTLFNYPQQRLVLLQPSANSNNHGYNLDFQNGTINMSFLHERWFGSTAEVSDSNTRSGLLQDIVPSCILKQGKGTVGDS